MYVQVVFQVNNHIVGTDTPPQEEQKIPYESTIIYNLSTGLTIYL